MSDFDPEQFQGQVMRWASHNFPNTQTHQPLLGIVEEFGEFVGAVERQDHLEIEDAIGDMMIFLAHYCGMNGYSLFYCASKVRNSYSPMLYPDSQADGAIVDLMKVIGQLSHAHLKGEQKIRKGEKHRDKAQLMVGSIVGLLGVICRKHGKDLTDITGEIWSQVSKRDWRKNAETGAVDPVEARVKELSTRRELPARKNR